MGEQITGTNTKIANTIEDVFKTLLKLVDEKESYLSDKAFLKTMKDKEARPVFLSLNNITAKRLVKEMEDVGIPYMHFRVKGSTKDILLIRPSDVKKVQDLENSIRIHAGLEIDTKEELDRALCLTDPKAKETVISGLTEYEADRIIQLSQNTRPKFTVVKEEMQDGLYCVATHEKNKEKLHEFAVTAILENETKTKDMAEIIAGRSYLNQQKKEFAMAVLEVRETNRTKPAYLFSLTEPERYIRIQESGFEIVDRGMVTHSMNIANNPELYPDILKLIGNSIESPVFKLESEIKELGGMRQALEEAKTHIPSSLTVKNYPIDLAFKKWVNESLNTANGFVFENPNSIKTLEVDRFADKYLREHPEGKELMGKKLPYYKKQLDALMSRLESITLKTEIPTIGFDDILYKNGIKLPLHEDLYSKAEVEVIQEGKYQDAKDKDAAAKEDNAVKVQADKAQAPKQEQKKLENTFVR